MKDFFGQDLVLGDEVAFMEPHYRNMTLGKIIKFTPQTILIEYLYAAVQDSNPGATKNFRATPSQVIKKPA
jgi:hypothetical protein